jgi:hypothetical protein
MKAATLHGKNDVRVETVPDPQIEQPPQKNQDG